MTITIYGGRAFRPELKGVIRDIRPVWTLEELGVPYERVSLDLAGGAGRTPEYLAIHPFGRVPSMDDGGFKLFESAAICCYLAQKFGKLIPSPDSRDFFVHQQWCFFSTSSVEPWTTRLFGTDVIMEKNDTTAWIRKQAVEALKRFLTPLNDIFNQRDTIMPSGFTVADIMLTTALHFNPTASIYEEYASIRRYLEENRRRPAFQKALAINGV
jgi:glutathione S-transferase